jgi:DNA-binding winged helix-turn-helix (wHTH) protein
MSNPIAPSQILSFGDFEIDVAQFTLKRAGMPLTLEPRVFDLLSYMVRSPNRLLQNEELLEQVWQGVRVSRSALHYSISQLRRTLAPGDGVDITTVRRRGYRFQAEVRPVQDCHCTGAPTLLADVAHAGVGSCDG